MTKKEQTNENETKYIEKKTENRKKWKMKNNYLIVTKKLI